jgi:hypothetical protein
MMVSFIPHHSCITIRPRQRYEEEEEAGKQIPELKGFTDYWGY